MTIRQMTFGPKYYQLRLVLLVDKAVLKGSSCYHFNWPNVIRLIDVRRVVSAPKRVKNMLDEKMCE